jgi:hypothetical protein
MEHDSLVIILSSGGARLERDALDTLDATHVTWVRVEREGDATCLAARVRHPDPPDEFRARTRRWGAARGWSVAVASGRAFR